MQEIWQHPVHMVPWEVQYSGGHVSAISSIHSTGVHSIPYSRWRPVIVTRRDMKGSYYFLIIPLLQGGDPPNSCFSPEPYFQDQPADVLYLVCEGQIERLRSEMAKGLGRSGFRV